MYPLNDQRALLSSDGKGRPKRMPIGYYDETILCKKCDNKLGKYDQYGMEIFLRRNTILLPNTDQVYLINNVNYSKIKMFLLSLLYRASITSRQEFSLINVGDYINFRDPSAPSADFARDDRITLCNRF